MQERASFIFQEIAAYFIQHACMPKYALTQMLIGQFFTNLSVLNVQKHNLATLFNFHKWGVCVKVHLPCLAPHRNNEYNNFRFHCMFEIGVIIVVVLYCLNVVRKIVSL